MRNWHQTFRDDYERHHSKLRESGLWAMVVHRLGTYVGTLPAGPVARTARTAHAGLSIAFRLATRTRLPAVLNAGEGLRFVHALNVTIGDDVVLGERVEIMQDVTIDRAEEGGKSPRIGNDVFIGAGATILGGVTVGDGASIGANTLVISDVPPGLFAIGVPAKLVRWGKPQSSPVA